MLADGAHVRARVHERADGDQHEHNAAGGDPDPGQDSTYAPTRRRH
jgi:hypothetical protein